MTLSTVDFSKKSGTRPSARVLRGVRRAMEREGAVAFAGLFPMSLLRNIRSEVLRRHESGDLRARGLVRDIGGRYAALLPFEGPFLERAFYANTRLHAMLGVLLGPGYCIGSLEAVISLPGASRQHQHIDGPIRFDRTVGGKKRRFSGDLSGLPPYAVTLCVPLCDLDETNGPTALWPGSHRAALRARPPSAAEVSRKYRVERMAGKFGRCFLFDYRTYHGGEPNLSREPRPLLMFVFTRSWYRDPNLTDIFPRVVISKRALAKIPERDRFLFMLSPNARRPLWSGAHSEETRR